MTFIDFCAGIGGGRLGLELNGLQCIGYSEIDKEAVKTYKKLHDAENEINFGDITKINPALLPDFDLLIAGFPCQKFSIVGKREGLKNDKEGQIIYYLAEILRIKQPQYFILENVKGLVNHNGGKTFQEVLKLLEYAGYNVYFDVINSINFLPQSRERIYFIGIKHSARIKYSYSELNNMLFSNISSKTEYSLKTFLNPTEENLFAEVSASYKTFLKYLNNKYNKGKFCINELLRKDYLIIDIRQSDLRLYENRVPTLRRNRQGILYVYKNQFYTLGALDALRLQGFDKIKNLENKIIGLKKQDILKQCGNAMSVNVIENLAFNLLRI